LVVSVAFVVVFVAFVVFVVVGAIFVACVAFVVVADIVEVFFHLFVVFFAVVGVFAVAGVVALVVVPVFVDVSSLFRAKVVFFLWLFDLFGVFSWLVVAGWPRICPFLQPEEVAESVCQHLEQCYDLFVVVTISHKEMGLKALMPRLFETFSKIYKNL